MRSWHQVSSAGAAGPSSCAQRAMVRIPSIPWARGPGHGEVVGGARSAPRQSLPAQRSQVPSGRWRRSNTVVRFSQAGTDAPAATGAAAARRARSRPCC